MENLENNKMIAEFMGFKSNKAEHYKIPNRMWHTHNSSDSYVMHHSSNLLFDKEWNWLMPVVAKCHEKTSLGIAMKYKIEEQYSVVVSFIKSLNERGK